MSEVVQFREDEAALAFLRQRGINPNAFAREAFERAMRRLRAEETIRAASKVRARLDKPIEDLIREDRESH